MVARVLYPLIALTTLVLTGCGSSHGDAGATAAAGANATAVSIAMLSPKIVANQHGTNPDAFYLPNPLRVRVGQTVTWTNEDNDLHDVTAESGVFASGPLAYGGTFRWTARRPGTYRYVCTLHPEMHGVIIVRS